MSRPAASLTHSSRTWTASSRVGTRARACVPGFCERGSRRSRMGMQKAAVLPVPVWAWPIRSMPARALGISPAWIGVGSRYSASWSEASITFDSPMPAKPDAVFAAAFSAGLAVVFSGAFAETFAGAFSGTFAGVFSWTRVGALTGGGSGNVTESFAGVSAATSAAGGRLLRRWGSELRCGKVVISEKWKVISNWQWDNRLRFHNSRPIVPASRIDDRNSAR